MYVLRYLNRQNGVNPYSNADFNTFFLCKYFGANFFCYKRNEMNVQIYF